MAMVRLIALLVLMAVLVDDGLAYKTMSCYECDDESMENGTKNCLTGHCRGAACTKQFCNVSQSGTITIKTTKRCELIWQDGHEKCDKPKRQVNQKGDVEEVGCEQCTCSSSYCNDGAIKTSYVVLAMAVAFVVLGYTYNQVQ